jgi:RNA polymerase sigma-54 factor
MAMAMPLNQPKLTLDQSLKLQLKLSPKLQQAIKLLALPILQLKDRVDEELLSNPVLEAEQGGEAGIQTDSELEERDRGDEAWEAQRDYLPSDETPADNNHSERDWEDYLRYDPRPYRPPRPLEVSEEDSYIDRVVARETTLNDHLLWQLRLNCDDERRETIATVLVGNLDDDGYLRGFDTAELAEDLDLEPPADAAEIEKVLTGCVQGLDPLGVGARDLRECLFIQLAPLAENGTEPELVELARRIIDGHLSEVAKRKYKKLARTLKVDVERLREAVHLVAGLDPKPARNYTGTAATYVKPDVFIEKIGDEYRIYLNEWGIPRLRISNYYRRLVAAGGADKQTKEFIRDKINSAVWFIKNIDERRRTILSVTEFIFEYQRDFLTKGLEGLRPLTLDTVAEAVDLNPSTVSRATSGKYVQTPRGLFELRFFFSGGISTTDGGEGVSTTYIKERIRRLIAEETTPLSDQAIADTLHDDEGLDIARRTVAKYRKQMKIPSSSRRKPL